ncbi:conserved exported hypothetical protein [Candidatus Sulfopaludibacter sp. SbA6]|nr:conserved exported hypothetical protein [Candidatus Sulfopaludibacter sp. SbA6]
MSMRPGALCFLAMLASVSFAQTQTFAVVSAASYQPVVAPDSLATIFGVNLAASAASATLDANGQLPTVLAGTSVMVDGLAAALIYVSPTQINLVIPGATTPGTASVTVESSATGGTQAGAMQVALDAPAVFTTDASGRGAGAILNAVTYAGPPFLVETPQNGGSDLRTRLAIYATGLRYATNVQAQGQNAAGTQFNFTVEYAGAAPGYFGLDQVNIVLPPELDGAGIVSLLITTELAASNTVTFQMGSLPANEIRLIGLSLSQSFVNAGDSVTGTVQLNAPARSIGLPVSLRGSSPAIQVPLSLTIPAGQASAQFPIATSATVTTVQTATITAQAGGVAQTATLEIDPPSTLQLAAFTVTPSSVQGGLSATGAVVLSGVATAGGAKVAVASDNAVAQPPASVTIPFNSSSTTFSIPTSAVTAAQTANLTATLGRISDTAQLTVAPALQLTLTSSSVIGGNSVTGTVTIGNPAALAGVNINLRSDNTTIAQAPLSVNIPSGQDSTTFTITTILVTVSRTVTITATSPSFAQASASVSLTVTPVGSGTLASLTVSPAQVTGGANATATVTLTGAAPPGGTVVTVQSNSTYAHVPQLVTVPQGLAATTFTITTTHPPSAQTATITAIAGGVTKTATLTVE